MAKRNVTTVCVFALLALSIALPISAATPKRVEYKTIGDVKLALHVFYPADWKASDQRPAAVFFFGGGWVGGSPSQFYPQCKHLAAKGIVAAAAEYRVKKKHGTSPFECVADGKSAVRWLRTNADKMGIDPDRIIAGGGSAGGHVAACTGVIDAFDEKEEDGNVSSKPNVMVLFNPVIDTSKRGYGYDKLKDRFQEISPVHHVRKGIAPTIIFVGTSDTTTPAAGDRKFCELMKEVDNRCELHEYKGRKHGFFNKGRGKDYSDTIKKMDTFLKSLGYL